jgi:hypothetical protein
MGLKSVVDGVSTALWRLYWQTRYRLSDPVREMHVGDASASFHVASFDTYQWVCMPPKPNEKPYLVDLVQRTESDSVVYDR